jgi:hypothetical protein
MTLRTRILVGLAVLAAAASSLAIAVAMPLGAVSPPSNDSFARARVVGVTGVIAGSTAGATAQRGEPGAARGDRTVWFAWTPPAPGQAFVVATAPSEAVRVRAYSGSSLRRLARADVGGAPSGAQHVLATIDAFAGTTYKIQVDAGSGSGAFALQIVQPQPGRPPNSVRSAAAPLDQPIRDAATGNLAGASVSGTTAGAPGASHPVFYRWTAPAGTSGALTAELLDVTPGARLRVGIAGRASGGRRIVLETVAGRTYTLAVAGPQAYFTLALRPASGFQLDTTPPSISCPPPSGWADTNDAVRCHASDTGSGLAKPALRAFTLVTSVPAGTAMTGAATNSVPVCDRAGNCATAGPVTGLRIDRVPPTVGCDPAAATGWRASVTVQCHASDPPGGSGLADPADGSFTLTATLPAGQADARVPFARHAPVCDLAGNCTSVAPPAAVAIDRIAPRVSCARAPAGWVTGASIRCTAFDGQSGLASPADRSFTLATAVAAGLSNPRAYTSSHAVCDLAGNCATAGPIGPIKVDAQPPVVNCRAPRGWIRGEVARVRCSAVDHGSGLAHRQDASFALVAGIARGRQAPVQVRARRVCDVAGNCIEAGPFTVELDDAPPAIKCDPVPARWQAAPVTIACAATDVGSGVRPAEELVLLQASIARGRAGIVGFPRRRICDNAGNCTLTPRLRAAKIDRRPPAVRCSHASRRRHRANVTVRCHASDHSGSGIAGARAFELRTSVPAGGLDGQAFTGSRAVCDRAGNCIAVGPFGPFDVDRRRR